MAVYRLIAVGLAFQGLLAHAETECSKAAEQIDSTGLLQSRTAVETEEEGNDDGDLVGVPKTFAHVKPPKSPKTFAHVKPPKSPKTFEHVKPPKSPKTFDHLKPEPDAKNVSPPDETMVAVHEEGGGYEGPDGVTKHGELHALTRAALKETPADAEHNGDLFTSDGIAEITGSHAEDDGCGHAGDPHECFQGDMQASGLHQLMLFQEIANGTRSKGSAGEPWKDKKVKYCFAADISPDIKHLVMLSFDQMKNAVPCMSFEDVGNSKGHKGIDHDEVKECNKSPAIFIQSRSDEGCWSYVGELKPPIHTFKGTLKAQLMNLQPIGCEVLGIVIHELGHAVGMAHEQARPDRAKFVTVHWENIKKGMEGNFKVAAKGSTAEAYDYESLMHYASHDFSKNGGATLTTTDGKHDHSIGQRVGLSQHDADQLAAMYKCKAAKVDGKTGCHDKDASCASLKACSKPEHSKKCCGCGGGTTFKCWSGKHCKKAAKLPVASEKTCIQDRTADFGHHYPCVTQNSCQHAVKITCPEHPGYFWDYHPTGCCQLPPFKEICGNTKCKFTKA